MIDARIQIGTLSIVDEDVLHDAQLAELLDKARELGKDLVRVEVEYPSETVTDGWDSSGDAVEIDFRVNPPTVTTLPPYSEVTP